MRYVKGQSGNKAGRPKGSLSSKVALKNLLNDVFNENEDKARKMLTQMFNEPSSFKWLCELKASLEPKEIEAKSDTNINIKVSHTELEERIPCLSQN